MAQIPFAQIAEALWSKDLSRAYRVWAVLDGARDRKVYGEIVACNTDHCCLFSGELPSALKIAAPYLVSLDPEDRSTRNILKRAWGNSWGIFLRSTASMETLRRHLKGLLTAKDPRGRKLFFRYYDPRVLRVYLPTCWPAELEQVCGPITAFLVEGADGATAIQYRHDEGRLTEKAVNLEVTAALTIPLRP